ncbi:4'-phosphopantetheinyl transferase family protein [Methylovirgula sp. 4M-Z18]|uniref:4'-phosphopantetheinyl transferase family protein n=1 Tax=Methylovirgula sp. 4M-Z18 TaxID=2293567 RepID=UPI000E2F310F|nr:4'-phosphopantetheinyl transferase superfamily protein [Methylovirgula sp. 4M-Z18]
MSDQADKQLDLGILFPPQVEVAVRRGAAAGELYPEEAALCGRFAPKRLREFAMGRLAARQVLARMGIEHFPLLKRPDETALWPEGITGSITHTDGICLVAAARAPIAALGIDAEIVSHVTAELWQQIFTQREAALLHRLSARQRQRHAAAIFSAKEAFYKCQYVLTGEWLEFEDIEVAVTEENEAFLRFAVRPQRTLTLQQHFAPLWHGRAAFPAEDLVVTGVVLSRTL